jgi:pilus assembly protein Flp/PilA
MNWLKRFLHEEDGPTAVEYAVMLALIIVVCIVAIGTLGSNASSLWGSNESNLDIAWQAGGGGS